MLNIRNRQPYILSALLAIVLLTAGSCSKLCNTGYEGSRCNVLETAKFAGRWAAVDTPGNLVYVDTITQGALYDIALSSSFNAHHFSHPINAAVQNDSLMTIPYQQPDNDSNFVEGSAVISKDHNSIAINYQILMGPDSGRTIKLYSGNWIKQN